MGMLTTVSVTFGRYMGMAMSAVFVCMGMAVEILVRHVAFLSVWLEKIFLLSHETAVYTADFLYFSTFFIPVQARMGDKDLYMSSVCGKKNRFDIKKMQVWF